MVAEVSMNEADEEQVDAKSKKQKKPLSLWFARGIVSGYFMLSLFLTYRHILAITVVEDGGGEVKWTAHLAITLVWIIMIYLGYWLRSKSLRREEEV